MPGSQKGSLLKKERDTEGSTRKANSQVRVRGPLSESQRKRVAWCKTRDDGKVYLFITGRGRGGKAKSQISKSILVMFSVDAYGSNRKKIE
jgi:hypothetical protein